MRIWLNHWFSTSYNIINLMKKGEDSLFFVGSNRLENAVMKCACDEWYKEPYFKENSEDYLEFCLNFCEAHDIEIFIPHYSRVIISKNKDLFEKLGIKVLVDDYEIVSLLDDKIATYKKAKELGVSCIPDYEIATTEQEFYNGMADLRYKYDKVCCKKSVDIGAKSFSVLSGHEKIESYLAKTDFTESPIMIMPYFRGDEISVDCLNTSSGIIMIPRRKNNTCIEHIEYNDEVLSICDKLVKGLDIKTPCNIQFITDLDDNIYLLEINPRMSGGIHMACLGAEVNIPNIALNKLLGVDKEWSLNHQERYVSHVETPLLVS